IDVKVGETIKFVLVNKGEQAHELTVGDAAYHDNARQMMTMMTEMGMDPSSPEHAAMHAGAGNTAIAQPGQSKEVVWTFSKPGNFEFSCNMIGHSEAGMKGAISVK
ncbi:MAG TPA: copper-binding protein, partial [Alphaproteobacteria bacterium]|nr:copper-binding protein [Alphaproteobacteria bacterium]